MKITNSSIHNKPIESHYSAEQLEKFKEAQGKINKISESASETADTLSLSDKAKRLLEAAELVKEISMQLEAAADFKETPYDELTKCMLIATRIMKGDKVPQADIRFLAEKEPDLYSSALLMRQNNEKPKRHKSLLEDEPENTVVMDTGKVEIQEALADRIQPTEE